MRTKKYIIYGLITMVVLVCISFTGCKSNKKYKDNEQNKESSVQGLVIGNEEDGKKDDASEEKNEVNNATTFDEAFGDDLDNKDSEGQNTTNNTNSPNSNTNDTNKNDNTTNNNDSDNSEEENTTENNKDNLEKDPTKDTGEWGPLL